MREKKNTFFAYVFNSILDLILKYCCHDYGPMLRHFFFMVSTQTCAHKTNSDFFFVLVLRHKILPN